MTVRAGERWLGAGRIVAWHQMTSVKGGAVGPDHAWLETGHAVCRAGAWSGPRPGPVGDRCGKCVSVLEEEDYDSVA